MSAHTPGPWTTWPDDGTGTLPCVLSRQTTSYGNFYVAQCNVFDDARLVAAAPDLLQTLQALLDWCRAHTNAAGPDSCRDLLIDAWHAIEKATGEEPQ